MKYLLLAILCLTAHAKRFASDYVEFELPSGWECVLEGAEYVCQSNNKDRKKEAIIVMAAKKKGKQDSLEAYTQYLMQKKTYVLPNRKKQVSEPRFTNLKMVNKDKWVDSLHMASEVPGFYTRYLATVKGETGVAVTFSVSKDHYSSYQSVFDKVIESMRVFDPVGRKGAKEFKLRDRKGQGGLLEDLPIGDIMTGVQDTGGRKAQKKTSGAGDMIFYLLLALGVGGFLAYKRFKK